jgi:2-polyprenyl-3-methyl-5-hydroxy-6-metoxy-1,4-benzoquinol methylase
LPSEGNGRERKGQGVVKFTGERYVPQLDEPVISFEHWHRYLWIAPFVAGKTVLDVACGEGYGAALLAEHAAHVTGIDSDSETIRHAQMTYAKPNLVFGEGSAQALPIDADERFDVVVSFETIEHLDDDSQRLFLAEVKRVLKPGGLAVFSTPNRATYSDRPGYRNPFHEKEFSAHEFAAFLGESFGQVHLLGQRMYAISYLWALDGAPGTLHEYQLDYVDDRYSPATSDKRRPLYLLAVCADEERTVPNSSVLVDVADRILDDHGANRTDNEAQRWQTGMLLTRLEAQLAQIERLQADAAARDAQIEALKVEAAHREAHIALLTERHAFLTEREAESRKLLVSAHTQLMRRDADYHDLQVRFQQWIDELLPRPGQIQESALSKQIAGLVADKAEMETYIANLEHSWEEKNAHIAQLEARSHPTPPRRVAHIVRRLRGGGSGANGKGPAS